MTGTVIANNKTSNMVEVIGNKDVVITEDEVEDEVIITTMYFGNPGLVRAWLLN